MFIINNLKEIRLKCNKLSKSQSLFSQSNLNEEIQNKIFVFAQHHEEMKNVLELANEMNNKAILKEKKNAIKLQNALKELNDLRQENKILEEYISKTNAHCENIKKLKQENDYLHIVYKKNVETVTRLKDEMLNNSQNISFDEHPLFLDLDNSFLGFDSVIISKSETQIDPQCKSYQNLYYKIQKDSSDIQNTVNSLLNAMKETNLSIVISIEDLNLLTSKITRIVKETRKQCIDILKNDHEVIDMLFKKRCVLEQIKLNSVCHLNILESDFKAMGNRVKVIRIPTNFSHDSYYPSWYLKKLSIQRLYRIWSKIIQWSYYVENTNI